MQGPQDFIHRQCQCLTCIIKSAAAADDDDGDAALSYNQRSERAGQPVGPARWFGNIVVTLNFASIIFMGKQEGIRWPSPRGAGPAKRSCLDSR